MRERMQDSVSFAVISLLVFVVFSLSFTSLTGSSGAGIRYLHLHWIVVRQDVWHTSVSHFSAGTLTALIAASLALTWALSRLLIALHHKKSGRGWLLFIFAVVVYVLFACQQDFVLT